MFLARLFANPYLLLTLTTLIWGGNAIASRLAVGEVTPAVLVSFRWIGVVILVVLFARGAVARDWPELRRHLPYLLIMGTVGFTAFNTLFYIAAHSTEALNIGILQGSIPIYVLLGAFVAYRSTVSGLQMIGVAVTILGVILVAARGDPSRLVELRFNIGDLLMLIACASMPPIPLVCAGDPRCRDWPCSRLCRLARWSLVCRYWQSKWCVARSCGQHRKAGRLSHLWWPAHRFYRRSFSCAGWNWWDPAAPACSLTWYRCSPPD